MFFLKYLEREINIHPSFFGQGINQRLRDQLFADLEGSCNGEYYVVCIMDIYNISPGKLRPGRGEAYFKIDYRAILWKPFKGETVRHEVVRLSKYALTQSTDRLLRHRCQTSGYFLRSGTTDCLCVSNRVYGDLLHRQSTDK